MRIIAHLDMDAFFAAIEERDRERLQGLPIVIGADPKAGEGRGVVSTANYKAREYGIHSAMPISHAWELSENAKKEGNSPAVFLDVDMNKYGIVSNEIMNLIHTRVEQAEQLGIDEIFLDLSFLKTFSKAKTFCRSIQKEIKSKTNLTASVGIGPNKLIAKIASDFRKPNGLTLIEPKKVNAFLDPLSIRKIPGVGPKTEAFLNQKGIKTIRDLRKHTKVQLKAFLGKHGEDLYDKANGRDDSPVKESEVIKSIGEQETFEKDTRDLGFLSNVLKQLCKGVWKSFEDSSFKEFRTITITVRFQGFETKNRSYTLQEKIKTLDMFTFEILKMFMPFLDSRENPKGKPIRLLGVRIEKLV